MCHDCLSRSSFLGRLANLMHIGKWEAPNKEINAKWRHWWQFSLVFCYLATPVKSCFRDGSFEEPVKAHEINDRIWVCTVLDTHRVGQSVPDSLGHNSHALSQMLYSIFLWRSFKVKISVSISTFWVSTLCFMVCLEVIQTDEGLAANRPTHQEKWNSGRLSDWQLITEFNF